MTSSAVSVLVVEMAFPLGGGIAKSGLDEALRLRTSIHSEEPFPCQCISSFARVPFMPLLHHGSPIIPSYSYSSYQGQTASSRGR
jgi:hypothetical protein